MLSRQPRLPASRASVGGILWWGVAPVCGEPTFQIRIVRPSPRLRCQEEQYSERHAREGRKHDM